MAAATILSKCDQQSLLASLLVVRSLGRCERWRPPVLAFPWRLILLLPNLNSVSYIHPCSKAWQRGSTSLFATENEIQRADSSKYFGLWRFREWHWVFFWWKVFMESLWVIIPRTRIVYEYKVFTKLYSIMHIVGCRWIQCPKAVGSN